MNISLTETAEFLKNHDNYYILTHQSPDGDTMGSGFGYYLVFTKTIVKLGHHYVAILFVVFVERYVAFNGFYFYCHKYLGI